MNQDDKGRHRRDGGDLDGLRAEAAEELDREEAGRAADASAQAAVEAHAARLDFEARQKDQARADAEYDRARASRDEADREAYEGLLAAEEEAARKAEADARAAGRPTPAERVAADREDPEDGSDCPAPDPGQDPEAPEGVRGASFGQAPGRAQ